MPIWNINMHSKVSHLDNAAVSTTTRPIPVATLREQHLTHAASTTKIRLSILSTALVDALGGPSEFQQRFSFAFVDSMIPNDNFSLPRGVWTDDTSMTLCLARSLATYSPQQSPRSEHMKMQGGFDEKDQINAYGRWHGQGELSAIGRCFDIGNTISRAITIYASHDDPDDGLRLIQHKLRGKQCAGNGSLMRVIPVGLAYWRDEQKAGEYGRRSSETTHPNPMCIEVCEIWSRLVSCIMQRNGSAANSKYTKLDFLHAISTIPYRNEKLREALTVPGNAPPPPAVAEDLEDYYRIHHPLIRLIAETQPGEPVEPDRLPYSLPTERQLPSSGYVLHTLVAALYCFFATTTFEYGAIMAVNLGNDADTVGAVYGGLAGCWYGGEQDGSAEGVFWTERVRQWKKALVKRHLVEKVAEELAAFSERLGRTE